MAQNVKDVPESESENSLLELKSLEYPNGPCARSGHRMFSTDSYVYVLGGYYPTYGLHPVPVPTVALELWKFNIAAKTWSLCKTTGSFPKELSSHSAVLEGNTLIVYGGTGAQFGQNRSNKVHLLNLERLCWTELTTMGEKPLPLYGQAVIRHEKCLYTIGGTDGTLFNIDIHKLDLKTLAWEMIFASDGVQFHPYPRYRHSAFCHDEKLFILGGGQAVGYEQVVPPPEEMKIMLAFDLIRKRWMEVETLPCIYDSRDDPYDAYGEYPEARTAQACVKHGDSVYMTGGRNHDVCFGDLWKLHLPSMRWSRPKLVLYDHPLSFHDITITPAGCLYTYGGLQSLDGSHRVNDFNKVWVTLPSLKEQAWTAIVEKTESTKKGREAVNELGIPSEFLDRIPPAKEP